MVLGGEAYGRKLGYEGGALISGISTLLNKRPKMFILPSYRVKIKLEDSVYEAEASSSVILISDFSVSRTVSSELPFLINYKVCG